MPEPPENQDQERLTTIAFAILNDIYKVGEEFQHLDPTTIAARIKRIHQGLNAEKEFHAITTWLGKTIAIHAIDDTRSTDNEKTHRAPDYLLIANNNGSPTPLLVEVKKTSKTKLSWKEEYLESLKRFANILNLPLLVAWKFQDTWMLVDTTHFTKRTTNYHLTLEAATNENLMCEICGDAMIIPDEAFQTIIEATIHDALPPADQLATEGWYRTTITSASLRTRHGPIDNIPHGLIWFLLCADEEHTTERVSQQILRITHSPISDHGYRLSRILMAQLAARHETTAKIDWNAALRKRPFPSTGKHYLDHLDQAMTLGLIQNVLEFAPQTAPPFLTMNHPGTVRVRAPRTEPTSATASS